MFRIYMFAFLMSVNVLIFASSVHQNKPDWAYDNYQLNSSSQEIFIGVSQIWKVTSKTGVQDALDQACNTARTQVAEFFEVKVSSKTTAQMNVSNEQFKNRFMQVARSETNIKLSGIKKSDTFVEYFDSGGKVKAHCLFALTRQAIDRVLDEISKDKSDLEILTNQTVTLILEKKYNEAEVKMAILKNKPNADFELIAELKKLLVEQQLNDLILNVSLARPSYGVGEILSPIIHVNKNSYVYVFVESKKFNQLIFPSPKNTFNLVENNSYIKLPLNSQVQTSEFYRIPSKLEGSLNITVLASIHPIHMSFITTSFKGYVVNDKTVFELRLAKCLSSPRCKLERLNVPLRGQIMARKYSSVIVRVNGQQQENEAKLAKELLKEQKLFDLNSINILEIDIDGEKVYSSQMTSNLYVVKAKAMISENILARDKLNEIYNSARLRDTHEKAIKLLIRRIK